MSIFDDLSNNSYLSKKAMNKQSGKRTGKAKGRTDEEYASDYIGRMDTEFATGFSGLGKRKSEARNTKTDEEYASELAGDTGLGMDTGQGQKSRARVEYDTPLEADTEFASDYTVSGINDTAGTTGNVAGYAAGMTAANAAGAGFTGMMAENARTDTEVASDMSADFNQYGTQTYSHAGVAFNKLSDNEAKITYHGLLKSDGASEVVAVYGYGSNQNWEDVSSITLTKDASGTFAATLPIQSGKNVNVAFKDTAQNWDNNSGLNYTFVN